MDSKIWSEDALKRARERKRGEEVFIDPKLAGANPALSREQMNDVLELVEKRRQIDEKIKPLKDELEDLRDQRAMLTNSMIGNSLGVSHNVIRQIIEGNYRWQRLDRKVEGAVHYLKYGKRK